VSGLTEEIKCRVDRPLKQQLRAEAQRTERSEGAVIRIALREYLSKRKGK
jgi:predicted transcriptional regulator